MKDTARAKRALRRASTATDDIERSLWLAKAADYAIDANAVLVGGAAVNMYTGVYRPTDVDMCAYLDESDRSALASIGFDQSQGDHFQYRFEDGERWLLEFPDTTVDGTTDQVALDEGDELRVISLESLVVDRIIQATDDTRVTFDEATRLLVATLDRIDWSVVESDIRRKEEELSGIEAMYQELVARARMLLSER